ncbi:MAG: nuclear transport factor 2 family protein [Proteobacteria bacterium]|nr:nuclear transport factor 2 family protein [Pseudomonadota bacterium]
MDAHETDRAALALVDRYIAAWNEADPARRRALVAETFGAAARYVDPVAQADGVEHIDAMIAAVQQRFEGLRFRRLGKVDAHNDRLRFQWALAAGQEEPLVIGTDVAVLTEDRRMQSVTGFFDRLPEAPSAAA